MFRQVALSEFLVTHKASPIFITDVRHFLFLAQKVVKVRATVGPTKSRCYLSNEFFAAVMWERTAGNP